MIIEGDAISEVKKLKEKIQCVITSPPYWQQRRYTNSPLEIGTEASDQSYIDNLITVFNAIPLEDDGTLWVNLGDKRRNGQLLGLPWRFALAMKSQGWLLIQDIIWHKPNPRPESCTKRCTTAHEYLFLFAKINAYYWDHEANQEPATCAGQSRGASRKNPINQMEGKIYDTRNRRSVWTIQPDRNKTTHTATFPLELVTHCVHVCSRPGDIILDPFCGSGTTCLAAKVMGREYIGIDLDTSVAMERLEQPAFMEWIK